MERKPRPLGARRSARLGPGNGRIHLVGAPSETTLGRVLPPRDAGPASPEGPFPSGDADPGILEPAHMALQRDVTGIHEQSAACHQHGKVAGAEQGHPRDVIRDAHASRNGLSPAPQPGSRRWKQD